jgi:single-strand DNA-binding protein
MSAKIQIVGNLTRDPELKFTTTGKALVNFSVATSTSRKGEDGTWIDADVTFWNCTAWEQIAENVAESLVKGDAVTVLGTAFERSWEINGEKKSRIEVKVESVSADLKRNPVKVDRTKKSKSGAPVTDPWANESKARVDSESVPF